jgi:hypothetical protein
LLALTSLLIIAALTAACPGPEPNGNNNNTVTTQSAPGAPTPCPTQGVGPDVPPADGSDDRPIIITGGSVDVDFNEGLFVPTNSTPGAQTFHSVKNKLVAFRVYDDDKSDAGTLICGGEHTFTQGGSLISIVFKVGSGGNQNMDIASDAANTSVDIRLNTDPATGLPKPDKSKYRHFNKKGNIVSVGWRDGTTGAMQNCTDLPSNKKMTIEVDTASVP